MRLPYISGHRRVLIFLLTLGLTSVNIAMMGQASGQAMRTISTKKSPSVSCEISIPVEGYIYYDPDIIFIQAMVTDPLEVLKVDFYMDSLHLGTDYQAPYHNMNLFNSPMGPYKLRAKVTYYTGETVTSSPVQIFVRCVREDLDNNGRVNINDFLILLGSFGNHCVTCHEDLNDDGYVNTQDYLRFLGNLGLNCD